ncbi:hypothetical protein CC85DRAFT_284034 [Cutaneotrichosporon oleaginosum]|uniref:Uncharacterized protein n=1 Tax=Cutaneotrichosporon oleaginosum TaxID=879819 RepID=A0A0J0XSC8_9TREE|nr:uncharacterized protein CC85DRAFT_284034 [Cutaneotrichosporon oleaginosum]KLT43993.1 hypothetical protein CC85DRAFT_284034 [Cutaneotrichosporon oleaginosum]TXT04060.1 hypothetical protein COLE_07757 [Cutaneotrichosporon oleaginosum]
MSRPASRAMSVSAAHALHFQIPKMPTPTPPSLLKRQLSISPRMTPRPTSPATPGSRRTEVPPRSPTRPRPSPTPAAVEVNEFEATFRAARPVSAAAT